MAGYSGTPLLRKLGLKAGSRVYLHEPPPNWSTLTGPMPEGARPVVPREEFDIAVLFARQTGDLEIALDPAIDRMAEGAMIWIAWPKKASGFQTDLSGDVVRTRGLATGLVDIKVCAIDEFWSGLKFVRRRKT